MTRNDEISITDIVKNIWFLTGAIIIFLAKVHGWKIRHTRSLEEKRHFRNSKNVGFSECLYSNSVMHSCE